MSLCHHESCWVGTQLYEASKKKSSKKCYGKKEYLDIAILLTHTTVSRPASQYADVCDRSGAYPHEQEDTQR